MLFKIVWKVYIEYFHFEFQFRMAETSQGSQVDSC